MLISLQEAASFLQTHYAVFEELWRRREDSLSDSEILAAIGSTEPQATPQYILVQLKKLRFLVESETDQGAFQFAPTFARWLEFLQQVARPVSSALVNGRLTELGHNLTSFVVAETQKDLAAGREILADTRRCYQLLAEDLQQTRSAIAIAVSEAKGEHRKQNAKERYRRINRLWTEYLLPMLELLNPTGQLEVVCAAWERQLNSSLDNGFLPERRTAERIEREMQIFRVILRQSFRECRNELEPLHAQLRRDSLLAEGAAQILARIERDGISNSQLETSISVSTFRYAGQISTAALQASAASWLDISVPPAPINFKGTSVSVESQAVEDILAKVDAISDSQFPLSDLLAWLNENYGDRGFHAVLQVFSLLVTDSRYLAIFRLPITEYAVALGRVRCGNVQLEIRKAL